MNTDKSSSFMRGLIVILVLLFVLTLGTMVITSVLSGGWESGFWVLNAMLIAIPIGMLYSLVGIFVMAIYRHHCHEPINSRLAKWLYWGPRISCIVFVSFMSLFALDVFEAGVPLGEMLLAFLMHMLPMIALAAVLAVAWCWPWVGATLFGLAGLAFSLMFFAEGMQGLSSFLVLGAPLLMIALLFAANARWKQEIDMALRLPQPVA